MCAWCVCSTGHMCHMQTHRGIKHVENLVNRWQNEFPQIEFPTHAFRQLLYLHTFVGSFKLEKSFMFHYGKIIHFFNLAARIDSDDGNKKQRHNTIRPNQLADFMKFGLVDTQGLKTIFATNLPSHLGTVLLYGRTALQIIVYNERNCSRAASGPRQGRKTR